MKNNARWVFGACVAGSLLFVAESLHLWGAAEIQRDFSEVVFLTIACAVWLAVATRLFPWLGISFRDDALERSNSGALVALGGAMVSLALIYVGGSVGEGPSYAENVFSVGLASAGFFVFWTALEIGGRVSVSIAEERDLASGIRLSGFLLSIGLVLGRAVAGDWHSASETIRDFIQDGWPAVVLCLVAVTIERFMRPNRQHPFRTWPKYGLLPVLVYMVLAGAWLLHLGAWEGMHQ